MNRKQMSQDCYKLINSDISKEQYYEGMLFLDKQYPSAGFKLDAERYRTESAKMKGPTMKDLEETMAKNREAWNGGKRVARQILDGKMFQGD